MLEYETSPPSKRTNLFRAPWGSSRCLTSSDFSLSFSPFLRLELSPWCAAEWKRSNRKMNGGSERQFNRERNCSSTVVLKSQFPGCFNGQQTFASALKKSKWFQLSLKRFHLVGHYIYVLCPAYEENSQKNSFCLEEKFKAEKWCEEFTSDRHNRDLLVCKFWRKIGESSFLNDNSLLQYTDDSDS